MKYVDCNGHELAVGDTVMTNDMIEGDIVELDSTGDGWHKVWLVSGTSNHYNGARLRFVRRVKEYDEGFVSADFQAQIERCERGKHTFTRPVYGPGEFGGLELREDQLACEFCDYNPAEWVGEASEGGDAESLERDEAIGEALTRLDELTLEDVGRCDACEVLYINRVRAHEHGCPRAARIAGARAALAHLEDY